MGKSGESQVGAQPTWVYLLTPSQVPQQIAPLGQSSGPSQPTVI